MRPSHSMADSPPPRLTGWRSRRRPWYWRRLLTKCVKLSDCFSRVKDIVSASGRTQFPCNPWVSTFLILLLHSTTSSVWMLSTLSAYLVNVFLLRIVLFWTFTLVLHGYSDISQYFTLWQSMWVTIYESVNQSWNRLNVKISSIVSSSNFLDQILPSVNHGNLTMN